MLLAIYLKRAVFVFLRDGIAKVSKISMKS